MSQDTWAFINTFAPWVSAAATFAVVLVSLYLARKDKRIRLRVSAGHRLLVTPGEKAPYPEFLSINIVNVGNRKARVTSIGWESGIRKKRYAVQDIPRNPHSATLPILLGDGDEGQYMISLREPINWLRMFCQDFLMPHPRIHLLTLRVVVVASVGKPTKTRVEKSLKKILLNECKKLNKA